MKLLAEFGFTFDLCIRHDQLPMAAELVRRVPQVTFVLDHFGKPDVRGKKTEPWAVNLKALAALPNVVCKISGLTTEADWKNWQPDDLKFYFETALECFGFDRILFGGDWPVATLATSYDRWLETVQNYCFVCQQKLTESNCSKPTRKGFIVFSLKNKTALVTGARVRHRRGDCGNLCSGRRDGLDCRPE